MVMNLRYTKGNRLDGGLIKVCGCAYVCVSVYIYVLTMHCTSRGSETFAAECCN